MTFDQPFAGYEILERVGSGAMGTVFKARDLTLERTVALKVLKPSLARNERYVERLRREARIVAGLNDPHIVAGYDLGEEGGYHFFVMEFVEGRSLRTLLHEWGMFPERQVLDVGIQVASALDHAYRRGVIHRDVKPGNVLITDDNLVKLTDMGLAKGPADLTITRDGATVGTPQYISPEQARDPQRADVRSDLYSLGATLFHMITGSPPFTGDTMAEVISKVLGERAPSASELNPAITDGLSLVIRKLLAKDPALRYQTPTELLGDLRRVEAELPPQVDVRRLERRQRGRRRVPGWVAMLTVAVVVFGFSWVMWGPRGGGEDVGGTPPDSVRELRAQLGATARLGPKLELIAAVPLDALSEADLGELEMIKSGLEDEFGDVLDLLFARHAGGDLRESTQQWFLEPEHWREPEIFREEVVEPEMTNAIGVLPADLPQAWRAILSERWEDFESARRRERDAGYRARYDDFLVRDLPGAWTAALQDRDFARAESALRDSLESFFGHEGRPMRAQLPDELGAWVDEREAAARGSALEVIGREEAGSARALKTRVTSALVELEQERRSLRPQRVREQYDRLRRELETHPSPDAFRPALNPWREVASKLGVFESKLELALREAEDDALEQAVNRAYRTLVATGIARDAEAWLEHVDVRDPRDSEVRDPKELRDRHLRLLRAAGDVVGPLLAAVLDGRPSRRLRLHRSGDATGSRVEVDLVSRDHGYEFKSVAQGKPMHVGQLYWPDLVEVAGTGFLDEQSPTERVRLRAGLALWRFWSGDDAHTMSLLDQELRAFFPVSVTESLDRARRLHESTDVSALAMLQRVRAEYHRLERERSLEAVQAALRRYRDLFQEDVLADDERSFLREVEDWVRGRVARQRLEQRFRALVPAGVGAEVSDDLGVTLTFGAPQLAAGGLPGGWVRDGDELAFEQTDVDLEDARTERRLEVPTHLENYDEVTLELGVRFPELPDRHRLYLFELHGVLAAVGLLRDGSVVATIGSVALISKPAELRRRLRDELARVARKPGIRVVAGADYRLRIRWLSPRRRVKATLWLDDVELGSCNLARNANPGARASLMPLQKLRVHSLVLSAR